MGYKSDTPELGIAAIAGRQHGVVTLRQCLGAGLGRSAVAKRARAGRLHRVHRGVYAVGHAGLSDEGRWMAAALACGDRAVLSHGSAAALWGMLSPIDGLVEVSVWTGAGLRKRAGIELHRCPSLADGADRPVTRLVTIRRHIPVTTPARTIADLAGTVSDSFVRRARRQAEFLRLPLGADHRTDRTRSDLERDFLRLCRRHGLKPPEVNVRIGRWTVDFLWRAERLVVETDGYLYHRGRVAFEDDRERNLGLRGLGYDVIRIADRQLTTMPDSLAALLEKALDGRSEL